MEYMVITISTMETKASVDSRRDRLRKRMWGTVWLYKPLFGGNL